MKRTLKTVRDLLGEKREAQLKIKRACDTENRARTAEEKTQWDTLKGEIADLEEEERFLVEADIVEARAAQTVHSGLSGINNGDVSAREAKDLANRFSIVRGIQLMSQNKPLDGAEKEVHEIAQRDALRNGVGIEGFGVPAFINAEQRGQTVTGQTSAAGDQGGVTVPTELNGLIEAVWQKSWLAPAGARRIAGLQGIQDFMVQETVPTINNLTEIEQMSEGEITFSKFSMSPARRGASIPFSKQLMIQSSVDIESLILDNLTKGLDFKLNSEAATTLLTAIASGNGNLLAINTNGGDPTYDHVVSLEALIESFETGGGSLRYLTNSKVKAKLKRTQQFSSTNGVPVFNNGQINEYPAVISNIIPSNLTKGTASGTCSAIVFGDFSYFYVGMWGGVDIVVDNLTRAKTGEVLVTTNMFWNTKVARAKSFAGIKDALTA